MSAVLYIIIWYYYINHISNVIFLIKEAKLKIYTVILKIYTIIFLFYIAIKKKNKYYIILLYTFGCLIVINVIKKKEAQ